VPPELTDGNRLHPGRGSRAVPWRPAYVSGHRRRAGSLGRRRIPEQGAGSGRRSPTRGGHRRPDRKDACPAGRPTRFQWGRPACAGRPAAWYRQRSPRAGLLPVAKGGVPGRTGHRALAPDTCPCGRPCGQVDVADVPADMTSRSPQLLQPSVQGRCRTGTERLHTQAGQVHFPACLAAVPYPNLASAFCVLDRRPDTGACRKSHGGLRGSAVCNGLLIQPEICCTAQIMFGAAGLDLQGTRASLQRVSSRHGLR